MSIFLIFFIVNIIATPVPNMPQNDIFVKIINTTEIPNIAETMNSTNNGGFATYFQPKVNDINVTKESYLIIDSANKSTKIIEILTSNPTNAESYLQEFDDVTSFNVQPVTEILPSFSSNENIETSNEIDNTEQPIESEIDYDLQDEEIDVKNDLQNIYEDFPLHDEETPESANSVAKFVVTISQTIIAFFVAAFLMYS